MCVCLYIWIRISMKLAVNNNIRISSSRVIFDGTLYSAYIRQGPDQKTV